MATVDREMKGKSAVDASCEIVIDVLYMTTDVLHSITNKLPVPMEAAQVTLKRERAKIETSSLSARLFRWIAAVIGVVAMSVGAVQVAGAIDSQRTPQPPQQTATIAVPSPADDARRHLEDGRALEALGAVNFAMAQGEVSADLRRVKTEALLELGEYREARGEALAAVADGHGPDFVRFYRASLEADPALTTGPRRLSGDEFEAARGKDGAVVVHLGGVARELTVAKIDDSRWASRLSAARLCAAIACAFDMPTTEHVVLNRDDVRRLGFDAETLAWRRGEDATEVVDATLTETIDAPARFPIEVTRTWRNLLSAEVDASVVEAPLAATIEPMTGEGTHAADVLRQRGDADSRSIGRQVGSMIAFDFLTTNWGRFERDKADYGENVAWLGGRMISVGHDHAFHERTSRRVRDRLHWMTRMPAETATAVRLLAPEFVDEHVLIGLNDRQREIFWTQRETFVQRVAELEGEYGRSRVLGL